MKRETALEEAVSTALANGEITVLYCSTPHLADARTVTRCASLWLHRLHSFSTLRLSRSATHGMGVVAAHRERVVGIDIEALHTGCGFDAIVAMLLHADELAEVGVHPDSHASAHARPSALTGASTSALSHVWVRKEATLKSFGVGLAVLPAAIVTGSYNEEWRAVTHGVLGTALVRSIKAPDGFAVGVALLGAEPASIKGFVFDGSTTS